MRKAELLKQEESFIKDELSAMGPGDPDGEPGTRGYRDGR